MQPQHDFGKFSLKVNSGLHEIVTRQLVLAVISLSTRNKRL